MKVEIKQIESVEEIECPYLKSVAQKGKFNCLAMDGYINLTNANGSKGMEIRLFRKELVISGEYNSLETCAPVFIPLEDGQPIKTEHCCHIDEDSEIGKDTTWLSGPDNEEVADVQEAVREWITSAHDGLLFLSEKEYIDESEDDKP